MDLKIIIDNFFNFFLQWLGKYVFRKTRLRYQYKERLKEIVDGFTYAIGDDTRTCSIIYIISNVRPRDLNKNIQIQDTRMMAELLGKWYSAFKVKLDFLILKHVSQSFEEFARILYEIHTIFNKFFQLVDKDEEIKNNLKNNSFGYPYFEKIYNKTTTDFEQLCKEASKNLKKEFKDFEFYPLPKL